MEQEAGNVALSGEGSFTMLVYGLFLTMLVYGIFLVAISPPHSAPLAFYRAYFTSKTHDGASCFLLGSSAFISWVFAKSIYNASTLGGEFGVMGGFAYACYYITFLSVGLTAYRLRTRYGYGSLGESPAAAELEVEV
ncbi:hypothetical protein JKP88DRAFT_287728 [Tribonema minus]|uniref:Uncharacterized protein n=1 Tax=Tribonema minus TaxID=303371 RepID=A0A836CLU5_9STRA|nr:hypothetical protein JKP88DRAFT_287728 [Tribonema minus]